MPGTWNEDDFTEGGLASVEEFIGRLDNVKEDVDGKFGLQLELTFSDVEIIEAGDDVTLDEGHYTSWVKQTNKKNSTNGKMFVEWKEFASAFDLGALPDCLYGVLIRYKRSTYEFGDDMTPGRAMVPVEVIDEGGSKTKSKTKVTSKTKTASKVVDSPPDEEEDKEASGLPEALVTAIHEVVGEEGATRDMIRRALTKKAAIRKLLTDTGGLDDVLSAMEDTLDEDDGTYTRVEEDDDPV